MAESGPPKLAPKPGRVTVYRALYAYTAQNVSYVKLIMMSEENRYVYVMKRIRKGLFFS